MAPRRSRGRSRRGRPPARGCGPAGRPRAARTRPRPPARGGPRGPAPPATMALNMKSQVKEMLGAGYDEEQILSYFERSYGEFVRLRPPLRGVNWLVWLAPVAGLLAGGAAVRWALRSPGGTAVAAKAAGGTPPAADLPRPHTLPRDG